MPWDFHRQRQDPNLSIWEKSGPKLEIWQIVSLGKLVLSPGVSMCKEFSQTLLQEFAPFSSRRVIDLQSLKFSRFIEISEMS